MRTLRLRELRIPFRRSFRHASAERSATQSIWVEAQSADGLRGFGEGCPREYVTGESIESARQFFHSVENDVCALADLPALCDWVERHAAIIDANPAAWCAIELALLDLLARESRQSVEALLGLPPITQSFHYTAVLGAEEIDTFRHLLARYAQLGFRDYKAKLSGDLAADGARLRELRSHPVIERLRLDANNHWRTATEAIDHLHALDCPGCAIEEPLRVGDYAGLRTIAAKLDRQIILDEGLLRLEQFADLGPLPGPWIINLRISKLGGLLRSLAIAARAEQLGVPVIIGCQVGETSLLTRAALTLAQAFFTRGLIGQEGAFGTLLLARDVVERPLMFGAGGVLDVSAYEFPDTPGFGLDVHMD